MTSPITLGFAGSSNTFSSTGYRKLIVDGLDQRYIVTQVLLAASGWGTFPNLVNFADLAASDVIIFDQSNDDANAYPDYEAFIRRAQAAGQRCIAIINPSWSAITDDQINSPFNETAMGLQIAICAAYGVPYIDGWQICKDHVTGGGHLNEMYADTAHWTAAGQAAVEALFDNLNIGTAGVITLPADYVHAETADFVHDPVIQAGTDYTARTGTWTDDGDEVHSSEVGATITYTFTGRKFGVWNDVPEYPTVTIVIDGGAPIASFTLYQNGYDIGTRAEHTVVVTVATEVRIGEFWAV
jgi:hypothetical protein